MDISVSIIFCHHVGDFIFPAVESARKQSGTSCEIIVASSIPDINIPGADRVIYVPGMPALKRNIAARYSHKRFLAFYDDDTLLDCDSVFQQWKICARKDVGMTFGKLLKMDDPRMLDEAGGFMTWTGFIWSRAGRSQDVGQFEVTEPIFAGKSASCMILKRLFFDLGGFDRHFGILGEESDLAWRVWNSGKKVYYCPKSRTLHAFGTKLKVVGRHYTDRRVFFNGPRNYLWMHMKNAPLPMLLRVLPIQLGVWIVASFGQLLAGRPKAAWLILYGLFAALLDLPRIIKLRPRKRLLHPPKNDPKISYFTSRLFDYWKTGIHGS